MRIEWDPPLVAYTPKTAEELDKKERGQRIDRKSHTTVRGVTKGVWFLKALNQSLWPISFTGLERTPAPPPLNFHLRVKDQDTNKQLTEVFASDLRAMTDQWIDSGKTGPMEDPNKRHLTNDLRDTIRNWVAVNQPDLTLDESGELLLLMPVFKTNSVGHHPATPINVAKQEAVRIFVEFYDSPYRYQLFKCAACGKYYFTERDPGSRDPIEHGTYCKRASCQKVRHRASAKQSHKNSDESKRVALILELAKSVAEGFDHSDYMSQGFDPGRWQTDKQKKKAFMTIVNGMLGSRKPEGQYSSIVCALLRGTGHTMRSTWVMNRPNILTSHWEEINAKARALNQTKILRHG